MPRCSSAVPEIKSVTRFQYARDRRRKVWGTNITFENGALLKFTGSLTDERARDLAVSYYGDMLQAGMTEAEILSAYPSEPTPAQAGKICPNCQVPFAEHKPCGSFAQAGRRYPGGIVAGVPKFNEANREYVERSMPSGKGK